MLTVSLLFCSAVLLCLGVSSRSPLAEPSWSEYFGFPTELNQSIPVARVRNISPEDFNSRIRSGHPFIIEDAGSGNPLVGATCEQFHDRFPSAQMRAEYTGGRGDKFVSLGGQNWFSKDRLKEPQEEHLSGGTTKLNAPYVWHVKDAGHEAPPEVRAAVQRSWHPPYFVKGATNLREANESAEFWFSRAKGAVLAHADTYCIPAISLQLLGRKEWRLMPPPKMSSVYDRYDSHDGGIYSTGLWQPTYHATVMEGEAIVFFPNLFHETFIPEENPPCTVATTFQIQLPVPTKYLRAFLPTHVLSHLYYEEHCEELWHSYATLRPPRAVNPTTNDEAITASASHLFRAVDIDEDGQLTVGEIRVYLASQKPSWAHWFLTEDYFYDWRPSQPEKEIMSEELLQNRAEDTLVYQDADGDGTVSAEEMLSALRQWNVVNKKLQVASKELRKGLKNKQANSEQVASRSIQGKGSKNKQAVLKLERQIDEQYDHTTREEL